MSIQYVTTLDRTFHALGDATRRGMLSRLAKRGESTAGELGEPFAISQPSASKHLAVLERAGLVTRRRVGREHRFTVRIAPLRDAETWIARHQAFWRASLDRLADVITEIDGR